MVTIDGAHEEDQGAEEPPEKLVKGFYAGLEGVLVAIVKGERVLCAIQGELEAVKAPLKFVMLDVSDDGSSPSSRIDRLTITTNARSPFGPN